MQLSGLAGPVAGLAFSTLLVAAVPGQGSQTPLDPTTIPQYVDPLPHFSGVRIDGTNPLTVTMEEVQQKVLPASMYPKKGMFQNGTWVWAYGIKNWTGRRRLAPPHYPGCTIEARRGTPTRIRYANELGTPLLQAYLTIDQTLHWANPLGLPRDHPDRFRPYVGPAPAVVHLHGGEVPSAFDGGPDQWFTSTGLEGPGYRSLKGARRGEAIYEYPNTQEATTLWFHDHTLGGTRINVYAGLAAFYFLRDELDAGVGNPLRLPADPYEIEIVIQDRMFDTNGQWYFPAAGDNPTVHPFWLPEFLGEVIVVNGRTWPYLEVEPRRYRFRFLNGSNARFYNAWLATERKRRDGPQVWQIGSDGGLLNRPVELAGSLLLAPGERADLIIDFRRFAGKTLTLFNDANAPFPDGDPVDPATNGQIMQFRVTKPLRGRDKSFDPSERRPLRFPIVDLSWDIHLGGVDARRLLTLNEHIGAGGPIEALVNNTKWGGRRSNGKPIPGSTEDGQGNWVTERPQVGATELWQIANLTEDAHPIHLHLVQFQLLGRQPFHRKRYERVYAAAFPSGRFEPAEGPPLHYVKGNPQALGGNPEILPYLTGRFRPAEPNESGWKDTVITYPGELTTLAVRFAPQHIRPGMSKPGLNRFPFEPWIGPGYVWHCHIIDHEDNEMMRPYLVRQ